MIWNLKSNKMVERIIKKIKIHVPQRVIDIIDNMMGTKDVTRVDIIENARIDAGTIR